MFPVLLPTVILNTLLIELSLCTSLLSASSCSWDAVREGDKLESVQMSIYCFNSISWLCKFFFSSVVSNCSIQTSAAVSNTCCFLTRWFNLGVQKMRNTLLDHTRLDGCHDKDDNLVSQAIAFMLSFSCCKGPICQKYKTHDTGPVCFIFLVVLKRGTGGKHSIAVCYFLSGCS